MGIGSSAIGSQYYLLGYSSTDWQTVNLEITSTTNLISVYLQAITTTGTQAVYFDSVEIKQIGCVSDFDLAFANPKMSLMVQNRASDGASPVADGTASAGVSQTQPIVQLNSTSARIGTTAKTVADGDLATSGDVYVGSNGKVHFPNNAGTDSLIITNYSSASLSPYFSADPGNAAANTTMNFHVDGAEKLKIDSAGNVTLQTSASSTNQSGAYGPSLQVGRAAALIGSASGNNLFLSSNALFDNSNWKLTNAGQAGQVFINTDGSFTFRQERTSGASGDNISWDDALVISAAGQVSIGAGSGQLLNVYQVGNAGNDYFEGGVKIGGASATLGGFLGYNSSGSGVVNITSLNNAGGANAKIQLGFGAAVDGTPDNTVMTLNQAGLVTANNRLSVVDNAAGATTYANFGPTTIDGATREGGIQIHTTSGSQDKTWGIFADAVPNSLNFNYLGARATAISGGTNALSLSSTGLATFLQGVTVSGGFTTLGGFNDLTIAAGAVTATSSTHNIDTEGGGATDYLDTINGGSTGSIITLMAANSSRTVVVEDGTNLRLAGDCTLDDVEDTITLIKSGSTWKEVSRSNNA